MHTQTPKTLPALTPVPSRKEERRECWVCGMMHGQGRAKRRGERSSEVNLQQRNGSWKKKNVWQQLVLFLWITFTSFSLICLVAALIVRSDGQVSVCNSQEMQRGKMFQVHVPLADSLPGPRFWFTWRALFHLLSLLCSVIVIISDSKRLCAQSVHDLCVTWVCIRRRATASAETGMFFPISPSLRQNLTLHVWGQSKAGEA